MATDDLTLVKRVRTGDQRAFKLLVERYQRKVFSVALGMVKDREEAISRMSRALGMFIVEGVHTTIPLHRKILSDPEFRAGHTDTTFIESFLARNGERK